MDVTVEESPAQSLSPSGYVEPLFHTRESRKEITEHLAKSSWLFRATEAPRPQAALETFGEDHSIEGGPYTGRVLASWREVDRWWEPGGGVDVVWRLVEEPGGKQRAVAKPLASR